MKILHLDTGREMRGGQHQVLLLLKGLRASGHECLLLAERGSPLAASSLEGGFPVRPISAGELWGSSSKFDIIHAHDAKAHAWAALVGRAPLVVSRRVSFPVKQSFFSRWKYRRAQRYLAVSRFVADRLMQAGVPSEKIDVVSDAIAPQPALTAWNRGYPVVAPSFRKDANKLSQLTEEACRLAGVELKWSEHLGRDLHRAAAFVYLTVSEGLGSAALLAMATGVPVVASEVEGLAEAFQHDRSGLYVANDSRQVARAIRRLFDEPGLAERLRQEARARAESCFSLELLVERTVTSYKRVLAA